MTLLHDVLGQISNFLKNNNDDKTDKFHYRYTVLALSIYLVILSSRQFYGDPIQCVTTDQTSGASKDYIHTICYINGTHRYDPSKLAKDQEFNTTTQLKYYPWIALFLVLQAFMFYFPSFLWKCINNWNGFDLIRISKDISLKNYAELSSDARKSNEAKDLIQSLTGRIKLSFISTKLKDEQNESLLKRALGKKGGYNVSGETKREAISRLKPSFPLFWSYMGVKLLYLANTIGQFFLIVIVYNINSIIEFTQVIINNVIFGQYEFDNQYFPKTSLCLFKLLRNHGPNEHDVLCALPLNLFNEIFYYGFWLWLMIISLITIMSITYWLFFTLSFIRKAQIKRALNFSFESSNQLTESTGLNLTENFNSFFKDVCTLDLFLAIKLIALNTSNYVAEDILNSLWYEYLNIQVDFKRALPSLPKSRLEHSRFIIHSKIEEQEQQEINYKA